MLSRLRCGWREEAKAEAQTVNQVGVEEKRLERRLRGPRSVRRPNVPPYPVPWACLSRLGPQQRRRPSSDRGRDNSFRNLPSRCWECLHRARLGRSGPVGMAACPCPST